MGRMREGEREGCELQRFVKCEELKEGTRDALRGNFLRWKRQLILSMSNTQNDFHLERRIAVRRREKVL